MTTTKTRRRPISVTVAALAASVLFASCDVGAGSSDDPSPEPANTGATAPSRPAADPELARAARETVVQRLAALRSGDRASFVATLARGDQEFRRRQIRYLDNLAKLPLRRLRSTVSREPVPATVPVRGDVQLVVRTRMQLAGVDERPVVEEGVWTFVRDRSGGVRLAGVRDREFDAQSGWLPAPWDVGRIVVRRDGPVLAVLDGATAHRADRLVPELRLAAESVADAVPGWPGRVLVYAVGNQKLLRRLAVLDVENTGGVTFPVYADPERTRVAGWRFAVDPRTRVLTDDPGFLFRHELTHVALGQRDEGTPSWLREGLAEYVAARGWPADERAYVLDQVASDRLARLTDLPDGQDLYLADARAGYAAAWVACEWIAETRGSRTLFRLVDAMRRAAPADGAQVDRVLRRVVGVDTRALAVRSTRWATEGRHSP